MASREKAPVTPAVRALRAAGVELTAHRYEYVPRLERVYINGGSRGFLVAMAPAAIQRLLEPTLVDVDTGRQR